MELRRIPLGGLQANCYLLCCDRTGQALVIDPGAFESALVEAVEGVHVPMTVATHGHWDHISGAPYLQSRFGAQFLIHRGDAEMLRSWTSRSPEVRPDGFLEEGQHLEVGDVRLSVWHLPGHSPGHVVFAEESKRWLFTGDLLLRGGTGGANVPGGDPDRFIESIARLRDLEGDWTIYPGHHQSSTMDWERSHNPYIRFRVVEAKAGDPGAS